MNFRKTIILLLLFISIVFKGFTQTTSFIHLGVEDGLVQSQVQTIEQDNEGNLWIGTLSGLSKYNGKEFKNYSKRNGLAEDWVTSSCKDAEGNLWFGHWGGSITKYDATLHKLIKINIQTGNDFKSITALAKSYDKLFIATNGGGIIIFDTKQNKSFSITEKQGLVNNSINDVCLDASQNIWVATNTGLSILPKNNYTNIKNFNRANGLNNSIITSLSMLENKMWLGTESAGIMIIDLKFITQIANLETIHVAALLNQQGISDTRINKTQIDQQKNIWIATADNGVIKFSETKNKGGVLSGYTKQYSIKQGLDYNNVKTIHCGRENTIWIGSDLGLNAYQGEKFLLYDEKDNLKNNIVWAVETGDNKSVWVGTNDGLSVLWKEKNGFENFGPNKGLPSLPVIAIHQDQLHNIWVGTIGGGLYKMESNSPVFKKIELKEDLLENTIYSITSDANNNVWFGTQEGAFVYNTKSKRITNYNSQNGLGGDYIYRLFTDNNNNIWISALGGQLTKYDGTNFKTFKEEEGISSKFILSINQDSKNNIWFATYGNGLYVYDGGKFKNYSTDNDLSSDSPNSIIADNDNNIWIATNLGIDKFDVTNEIFTHYNKKDGFLGIETNADAITKDNEGNIWIGTIMGLVKLNTREYKPTNSETITTITALKISLKEIEFPKDSKFKPSQNNITFVYTGVTLINSDKVRYQYMLEGFDKEWSPITNITDATYTNLPAGEYTFNVKSCNTNGVWNRKATVYKFEITPPLYQTWWARLLMLVVLSFLLFMIFGKRTENLKRTKLHVEEADGHENHHD